MFRNASFQDLLLFMPSNHNLILRNPNSVPWIEFSLNLTILTNLIRVGSELGRNIPPQISVTKLAPNVLVHDWGMIDDFRGMFVVAFFLEQYDLFDSF